MPRKPSINWRKSDTEKLNNAVKRFNAKVYRSRKKHPELADILPDIINKEDKKILVSELKESPRAEFNKTLNSLNRFTKRGAEEVVVAKTGNKVTRWEKNEVAFNVAQANRELTKERKAVESLEATSQGKSLGMKRGEMGSERLNALKPIKYDFDKIRGGKEWEKFKNAAKNKAAPEKKELRQEKYKENYLKGLDEYGGYADDIKDIVSQLPANIVEETYYAEQEAEIKFYYEAIEGLQEKDTIIEVIRNVWQNVLKQHYLKELEKQGSNVNDIKQIVDELPVDLVTETYFIVGGTNSNIDEARAIWKETFNDYKKIRR